RKPIHGGSMAPSMAPTVLLAPTTPPRQFPAICGHAWTLPGSAGRWPATRKCQKSGIEERSDRLLPLFFSSVFRGWPRRNLSVAGRVGCAGA
ncbi:hypothetical protein NTC87_22190, partial [Stenotrophomonas geniculata]|nr:hypothetical protein [Stenotrophomonas geniculata]